MFLFTCLCFNGLFNSIGVWHVYSSPVFSQGVGLQYPCDTIMAIFRCVQRPNWVLFGDSITQKGSSPGGWVARLQDAYQRRIDVFNRGYSGYNTRWARAILPHMRHIMKHAQLVTVFLGANDAALPDLTSAVQHVPLSEYRENLKAIISEIQGQGVKHIIMMTPPPVSEPHRMAHALTTYGITLESSERTNEVTRQYADACVEVGADLGVPVLNLWDIFMKDACYGDVLLNDGLHLTAKGNELVYTSLEGVIDASFPHLKSDAMDLDVPEFRSLISSDQDPMKALESFLSSSD